MSSPAVKPPVVAAFLAHDLTHTVQELDNDAVQSARLLVDIIRRCGGITSMCAPEEDLRFYQDLCGELAAKTVLGVGHIDLAMAMREIAWQHLLTCPPAEQDVRCAIVGSCDWIVARAFSFIDRAKNTFFRKLAVNAQLDAVLLEGSVDGFERLATRYPHDVWPYLFSGIMQPMSLFEKHKEFFCRERVRSMTGAACRIYAPWRMACPEPLFWYVDHPSRQELVRNNPEYFLPRIPKKIQWLDVMQEIDPGSIETLALAKAAESQDASFLFWLLEEYPDKCKIRLTE